MVVGFNHNFRYKGSVFHVQTEDGGLRNPQIVTLLFIGGTILASRKTSYADILKIENLEQVVEDLMKEQHREMLRQLKDGQHDDLIRERLGDQVLPASRESGPSRPVPQPVRPAAPPATPAAPVPRSLPPVLSAPRPAKGAEQQSGGPPSTLDDIILAYLTGEPGRKS